MTASGTQSKTRRGRRIIERPRLIKLLDETDARTVLLLAPAGFGKTTLARQWGRSLTSAIWVTLTPAHRDISVLATEISQSIQAEDSVGQYVGTRPNPQRAVRDIARVVASQVRGARLAWIIVDDYHDISASEDAERFIEVLQEETTCRFLIASRVRPSWCSARKTVYGELSEISRETLAMDHEEAERVLGPRADVDAIVVGAGGWPAVIGLLSTLEVATLSPGPMATTLHEYLTNELYSSASTELQRDLVQLALSADLEVNTLNELFGERRRAVVTAAADLGFLSTVDGPPELHPLFRDYLLSLLARNDEAAPIVDAAIERAAEAGRWEFAFQLIERVDRIVLATPILERAYTSLARAGRLGTLGAFAAYIRRLEPIPPPVVDLVDGEVALRDGAFGLAARIAERARSRFALDHRLATRASTIIGRSAWELGHLVAANEAYRLAFESATERDDRVEALRGWALVSIQGEHENAQWVMELLSQEERHSPLDVLRSATLQLAWTRFTHGHAHRPPEIDEGLSVLDAVDDPRARASFCNGATYALVLRADYRDAAKLLDRSERDIADFDLDFVRPYHYWNRAFIALGERRFGAAERTLQILEDLNAEQPVDFHVVNARVLRGRLALETGRADEALNHLPPWWRERVMPSMHGEYMATRALALAVLGLKGEAASAANAAAAASSSVEVLALSDAAKAVLAADKEAAALKLWRRCQDLGTWNALVAATRSSQVLADALASHEYLRPAIAALYERTNDRGLARRAGLRVRSTRSPGDLLTPRELEVLGLLAQGMRNKDISDALVISESTTKVHVRHILEKLGCEREPRLWLA